MFPVIDATGTARERGRIHGGSAKQRVAHSVATYARLFAFCGIDWGDAQRRAAPFREAIGALGGELLEEIEGIAEGAGRQINEILALNVRTEILPPTYPGEPDPRWRELDARNRASGVPDWGECTAIAVPRSASATGGTLLAQNWDWLGAQRNALVVLRLRQADAPACITLTEAGMLAKIGFNEHGFGLCLNILRSSADGRRVGTPVHPLLRALLGCRSVDEAIGMARALSFGASSNVLCADDSGDAANLEFSPAGLQVVRGKGGALCHTNHFLSAAGEQGQNALAPSLSSVPRLTRAHALVENRNRIGVTELKQILCDESDGLLSICRRPDPSLPAEARIESVASVIMELAALRMHVAPDVPSLVGFETLALTEAVPV
ncbi:MAG TPA: C45 family peptidase [Burkholderiales bacterium]|nr:C45 family peptidase [Burkholderiales bacterium]